MALIIAKEGGRVVVADIDDLKANAVADQILQEGGEAIAVHCDVSSLESVQRAASTVRKHLGRPSILINNAGIVSGDFITEIPIEKIERSFKVNAIAHFYTIKEFLPDMIEADEGHVVTIASLAGIAGSAKMTDYCASKFAAVGLTEALRNELRTRKSKVRTTCINPYYIDTGMFQGVKSRFIPILKEEYAGKRIVNAIRNDDESVSLPAIGDSIYFFRAFLSVRNFDWVADLLGMNRCMEHFVGRNLQSTGRS